MTETVAATGEETRSARAGAASRAARPRAVRLIAGYGAIACAIPYLALKVVWLSGGTLGIADLAIMHDASMVALNAITAGMDVVAIIIAAAFTHRWGLRMPAWLVLPPMWVATGLLSKFALAVPVTMIAGALTSGVPPRVAGEPVHAWVYAVVYTEFTGLGIGLMVAFVLYARARWGFVFQSTARAASFQSATEDVQVPLANMAALMAAAVGGLYLAWVFGSTVALPSGIAAGRTLSSYLVNGIDAALTMGAVVGVLMLVHGWGREVRLWVPSMLTWVGSGSLFGWGLWHMVNVLSNTALVRGRAQDMAFVNLLALVQLLAGLVIGLVMLLVLVERNREGRGRSTLPPTASHT